MKKYILSIVTIVVFSVGFMASSEEEQREMYINRCGVYEVTDEEGQTLIFCLNEDKTVTAHFKNDDTTYYGHVDYRIDKNLGISMEFSDATPILCFKVGINDQSGFLFTPDDYLYPSDRDLVDSKNPRGRLKVKRSK